MNFALSPDHQMLSDTLRRFFVETLPIEVRNSAAHTAPFSSPETWAGLAELGVLGAFLTEGECGFGGTAKDVAVIFEEVGRALCAEPLLGTLMAHRLAAATGQTEMAEKIASGQMRVALAWAEPEAETDLKAMTSTARRDGDNWRLEGHKTAIYGGPVADQLLIAALNDGETDLVTTQLRYQAGFDGVY